MNGYGRITAALRGERPDRVPVMLHNFMMAAREAGMTMQAFCTATKPSRSKLLARGLSPVT
jgi:hypothetical protein